MTDSSQDTPSKQPNSLPIEHWIEKGIEFQNAGEFQQALSCFVSALELNPNLINIQYKVGVCWKNLGSFAEAIAHYNACYQGSVVQNDVWLQAASQFCLGQCYVSLQQQEQAVIAYSLAYQLFSQCQNQPYTQQSWVYLDQVGNQLLNNKQFESAIQYYQNLLEVVKPLNNLQNLALVYHGLGRGFYGTNLDELAIESHRQMLEISRRLLDMEMENTALQWLTYETWRLEQWENVIDYFKQRLVVVQRLERPQEQPEILDWIIKGYKQLNQLENTIEYYQEKLKLLREKQDISTEYSTLYDLASVYFDLKQYLLAIERFKEALNLEPSLDNPYHHGNLNYMLGLIYYTLNQSLESIPHFERAIAVYEEQQRKEWVVKSSDYLEKLYKQTNDFEKLLAILEKRLTRIRESQDLLTEYSTLYDLASIYFNLKQYPLAIDRFKEALNLEASLDNPYHQGDLNYMLGLIYYTLNQPSESIPHFEKAIAVYEKQEHNKEWVVKSSEYLEKLYQQTEDFEKLIPILEKRLNRIRESQDQYNEYLLLYQIAGLYYKLENYSQAGDYYKSALGVAQGLTPRQPGNEANAYYMLGLMYHNLEKLEDAVVNYREALRLYTELNNQEWVEHSRNKVQELERILASRSSVSISQSDPQLDFLLDVLQAVADSQGNPQIVYPLLAKNLDKLDENLADILTNLATAKFKEVPTEKATNMAVDIVNFGGLIQQFPLGSIKNNLEITIAAYQAALEILTRAAFPEQWAMTQINLATVYKDRIKGEKADNIERAISAYQAALEILTRAAFPEQWATAQNNLAAAYWNRIKGEKADNIEQAIVVYQAALEIRTREAFPEQWAMTQNNLATAYKDRIKGEKADNIESAIIAYQAALEIFNCEAFPEEWAMTQNNLALAYTDRIKEEKADNIEQAITAYQATLEIRTREAFPKDWAMTQHNLAVAYFNRIKGEKADNIESAIAAYQAALKIRTREAFPEDWAGTQNNLANAYCNRIKGEKADNIETAITGYQAALKIRTRAALPEQWASTQNNLAGAYLNRIKGEKTDNIEQAITFYQDALEIYTREAFPEDWAMTQNNLAVAYRDRIKGKKIDNIELAIALYKGALEIYTRVAFPYNYIETSFNLGVAYQDIQEWQLAYETFDNAIKTVEKIRSEIVKGGDADKQKLAEQWQKLYERMVEVCIELKNYTVAIEYVERSKTRNLVELLATRDLYPKGDIPQTVLDELDRLRRDIETEQRRLEIEERSRSNTFRIDNTDQRSAKFTGLQTTPPDRNHLKQLQQQLDELITRDITPIDQEFRLTQKVETIPFSDIQALTSNNTAILEWYILRDKFITFIITPANQSAQAELTIWQSTSADYSALTTWTDQYLKAYQTNKKQWQKDLTQRLQQLSQILHINELLAIINKKSTKCDQLVLIPNRYLHLFPLHALPISQTEEKITYLLEKFPAGVSYAPSCQLLKTAKNRQRPNFNQLFAIQNPTEDLTYTDVEVNSIINYFDQNNQHILVKKDAKKINFDQQRNILKTAHCHHFSCHGYFNFENLLLSALILADSYLEPAPPKLDPSRHLSVKDSKTQIEKILDLNQCLTLGDIFSLDLLNSRLVTLSACETGLIDINSSSDEYIGLPSGFLIAGATNVISTLWSVNDLSTALLMIYFYQNIMKNITIPLALKQAQNWLRNVTIGEILQWLETSKFPSSIKDEITNCFDLDMTDEYEKPFAHPYHWAAFCAIGQ
jgi:CHAT domain-containing protein/CO dehydrogenase/acetyl-CoA synthase epsilon subunit